MGKYQNISIKELICERVNEDTFLPAIQREFVWTPNQIEKLFDSIMCGYPISSFLLWKIKAEDKAKWQSYEFIRYFDEEKPHNKVACLNGVNRPIFVLDGQQRITSMYIALKGGYRFLSRKKWRDTKLYLNLLGEKENDNPQEMTYQFLFKEDDQPLKKDSQELWYEVGKILDFKDAEYAKESIKNRLADLDSDEIRSRANRMIGKLYEVINGPDSINYYEENSDKSYDEVLEIFIRTNTGGQKLEYSDILLSTATAKWKDRNAREEINKFTDEINAVGAKFDFGKDFVMKGAMYLTEDMPIQYKISSFTEENLKKIEDHWEDTKRAISNSVKLVSNYGFHNNNLVAKLVLLPVAQYLLSKKPNYLSSPDREDIKDQNNIQNWLVLMLLKGVFGGASDTTLNKIRPILRAPMNEFPYSQICNEIEVEMQFSDLEIKSLLHRNYGSKYSYLILSLLYPDRKWKDNRYDEDHIYPQGEFTQKKLKDRGYDDDKIKAYMENYNSILNLELLTESENRSRGDTPFDEWLEKHNKDVYKDLHHIPEMDDYGFDNFLEFVNEREKLLTDKLKSFSL